MAIAIGHSEATGLAVVTGQLLRASDNTITSGQNHEQKEKFRI